MKGERPRESRHRGGRIDLVAGVLLGLALGVAIAYLLVIVVGGRQDASEISTPSQPAPRESRSGPGGAAPARP